jgi:hypothetical protein
MRADEFIKEEDKLNEVLPLIGLAARAAGGVAKGAAKTAKAAGGMLAKGINKAANAMPNSTKPEPMGAPDTPTATQTKDPTTNRALDRAKDQVIRPGSKIQLPTDGTGGPGEFKITNMQGDNVEIENPRPAPGEPKKVVFKRDDIKKSMTL